MAVNKKNLRYCNVRHTKTGATLAKYYDVIIAVSNLDEVNDILQEWALDLAVSGIGEALNLPEELIINQDLSELLPTLSVDRFAYLKSAVSSYMDMARFAGVSGSFPTLPATKTGSYYVPPACTAFLYSLPEFTGIFGEYNIAEENLALSSGVNYLTISYNSGEPKYVISDNVSYINYSSIIPVAIIFDFGGTLYVSPYGQTGFGLSEKIISKLNRLKRFEIDDDAFVLEALTRYIQIEDLSVWNGVSLIACSDMDTSVAGSDMVLYYKDNSSVWQTTNVDKADNDQYQSGSGLASLGAGEFVINNIFRVASASDKLIFNVLSNKFATLQDALNSGIVTDLPDNIKGSSVLTGRVILEHGSDTAVIQKVQKVSFGV